MSIKITSPNNGVQLPASHGVVLVRVSSPTGNTDFFLGNALVVSGKWSLSNQLTLGSDREIVAEGFDVNN